MTTDDHHQQSQIVEQIHADFRNSHSIILKSLNDELNELSKLKDLEDQIRKAEKMRALGFIQAKGSELKQSELDKRKKEADEKQKLLNAILNYSVKYPNYKYISESEVEKLCSKYQLVCGNVFRYTGEIPETNLEEILKFNELIDKKDIPEGKTIAKHLINILSIDGLIRTHVDLECNNYSHGGYNSVYNAYEKSPLPMKICAPAQYMDMVNVRISDEYKMESLGPVYNTDPVVLQPVYEGYLIVTAWGNEASDPLVVNSLLN